jgi:hypothetical protein
MSLGFSLLLCALCVLRFSFHQYHRMSRPGSSVFLCVLWGSFCCSLCARCDTLRSKLFPASPRSLRFKIFFPSAPPHARSRPGSSVFLCVLWGSFFAVSALVATLCGLSFSLLLRALCVLRFSFHQHHRMRDRGVVRAHAFGGLCLQPDAICRQAQQFRHMFSNRFGMRTDLRRSQYQRRIHIDHVISRRSYPLPRLTQKHRRVRALPLRVRRRKKRPDIRSRDCSQQPIRDRVQQHVSIGMPAEPLIMRHIHAANFERNPRLEFVRVPSVSNSHPAHVMMLPAWPCGADTLVRWSGGARRVHSSP